VDQDYGKVKYGVSRIVVYQVKDQQIQVLSNAFHSKQTATTEFKVDNEEFWVYAECDYHVKTSLDLTLSCYSSKPILIEYERVRSEHIMGDEKKLLLTALLGSYA